MNIVVVGTGNVAYHFCKLFNSNNSTVLSIVGRSEDKTKKIATELNLPYTIDVEKSPMADLYIIAVNDENINSVALKIPKHKHAIVVHTSGSTPINIFEKMGFENYGVLYPFQTFTKNNPLDINQIPFCLETNNEFSKERLKKWLSLSTTHIFDLTTEQRQYLHLAGVFAANFVNYLYQIAFQILEQQNIDPKILLPLILQVAKKIQKLPPELAQTGPAARNDEITLQKHLQLLANTPDYHTIYQILSKAIQQNVSKVRKE